MACTTTALSSSSSSSTTDNYNYEKNRLKSFQLWPCPNIVNPNELAKCGFYSTGFYMETQCNWCQISISDWQPSDQVMARHRRVNPFCPFIINPNGCGNIPLESDRNNELNNRESSDNSGNATSSRASSSLEAMAAATNINNYLCTNNDSGYNDIGNRSTNDGLFTSGEQRQQLLQRQQSSTSNPNGTTTQVDLKIESNRLATFKNWPNPNISPQSLAKAGFYYFNKSDHVRCAWCKGVIARWEKGDNAFQEHVRFFSDCPLVQLGPLIEITNENVSLDGIRDLGIQQISPPKTIKYSCLDARMRTYAKWPIPDIQNPEILAQAGFYYQEIEDQVRCFHCNGGLRSWQKEDDPWFEHAKWFPHCNFLKLVKGPNFVTQIHGSGRQQQSQVIGACSSLNEDGTVRDNIEQTSRQTSTLSSEPIINIDDAMQTEPVQRALEMGLNEGRVLNATRRQLESNGKPFDTTEELVEAVLEGQVDEEDDANGPEPSSSIVREVSRILNYIFNPRNLSATSVDPSDYDFDDIADFHGPGEGGSAVISSLSENDQFNYLNTRPISTEVSAEAPCSYHNETINPNSNCVNTSNINRDNSNSTLNENQELSQNQETNIDNADNDDNHDEDDADDDTSLNTDKNDEVKVRPPLNEQQSLEEENRKLKDARTCKVCMDDEVGVVFLPCGHLVTCVQCAPGVTVCPLCRSAIKGFVRTFLS